MDGRNPAPLGNHGNHCLLVFTRESSFQGFLGGAKWISQPSTVTTYSSATPRPRCATSLKPIACHCREVIWGHEHDCQVKPQETVAGSRPLAVEIRWFEWQLFCLQVLWFVFKSAFHWGESRWRKSSSFLFSHFYLPTERGLCH